MEPTIAVILMIVIFSAIVVFGTRRPERSERKLATLLTFGCYGSPIRGGWKGVLLVAIGILVIVMLGALAALG